MLVGGLVLLQVSLPALAPSGPLGSAGPAGSQDTAELTNSPDCQVFGQIRSSAERMVILQKKPSSGLSFTPPC